MGEFWVWCQSRRGCYSRGCGKGGLGCAQFWGCAARSPQGNGFGIGQHHLVVVIRSYDCFEGTEAREADDRRGDNRTARLQRCGARTGLHGLKGRGFCEGGALIIKAIENGLPLKAQKFPITLEQSTQINWLRQIVHLARFKGLEHARSDMGRFRYHLQG